MTKNHFTVELDDVVFQLQDKHDFAWLKKLGRVFDVFDQQDSGNINFGIVRDGENYLLNMQGQKL